MDGRQIDETYKLSMKIIDQNRERRMSEGMSRRYDTTMAAELAEQIARKKKYEADKWAKAMYGNDVKPSALDIQVSGSHYKNLKIQPVEYIHANGIPFIEGCVIKYMTRHKDKGGTKDLEKAKHFIDLLIELESK